MGRWETARISVCFVLHTNYSERNSSVLVQTISGYLLGKSISKLAVGGYLSFVLTTDQKLFTWGTMSYVVSGVTYFLGAGDGVTSGKNTPYAINMTVFSGKTIVDVKASASNALVLTSDGSVFSMGYNGNQTVRKKAYFNNNRLVMEQQPQVRLLLLPVYRFQNSQVDIKRQ